MSAWRRRRLVRSRDDRVLAGVAAGLAARLGLDPAYVRAAFVVLALAGGVGIVVYLGLYVWSTEPSPVTPMPTEAHLSDRQRAALALILVGTLLALRAVGMWPGDGVVWPAALVAFGLAVTWSRRNGEAPGDRPESQLLTPSRGRLVLGAVLMLAGVAGLVSALPAIGQVSELATAVTITAGGFILVFGPWLYRLAAGLSSERRERIRSEERAEMAAHLHDSVLQTLALIQRSDDPRRMVTLARAQERELRSWLFGESGADDGSTLRSGLDRTAARVEEAHDVPVDVVVVGDCPLDDAARALLGAAGEAISNAASHSGAARVSVYVEVDEGKVSAWISDQGRGFDAAAVSPDRRGIADSIVARMARHGGSAAIHSGGDGTEVHLSLPRSGP